MKTILLIDANLLLFKSFYAATKINPNPNNLPTHLFFITFLEILKAEKPDYVFFAFDGIGKTKRHEEFEGYKLGRTKAPDDLYKQKEIIRDILDVMNLKHLSKNGDEADDLIATLTNKYKDNNRILILSEDKDLLQLVDKNVSIIQKNKSKINERYKKINLDNFYEIYNFYPHQVIDYKGMAGDSSDNLPGIKGVGPKTSIQLLSKYNNLEGIYENLDNLSEKQKEIFLKNKEYAFMCKKLAKLNTSVDIDFDLESLKFNNNNFQNEKMFNILENFKLKKIIEIIRKIIN